MKNIYVYDYEGSTYLNLTNRCNNSCTFCIRANEVGIEGYNLWLDAEPTGEDVIAELVRLGKKSADVVICGYGEPTMNLDALLKAAAFVKENGGTTRLNTNGLGNAQHNMNIVPLLKDVIDVVSISLNDCDAAKYDAVCRSDFGMDAFDHMLDFARECVKAGMDTVMTVVDVIPKENIEKCSEIAKEIGARFRVRTYSDK